MKLTFYGVRGGIAVPGAETARYGGNTSCVALETLTGALFVLDVGTGATVLGRRLMGRDFGTGNGTGRIFLTHAHWDHIQGFPFFAPVFVPGNRFGIYGPAKSSDALESILEGQMNPQFSPLQTMRNLGATFEISAIESDAPPRELDGVRVSARLNPDGRTTALVYRFEESGRTVLYAPDAGYPKNVPGPADAQFYAGAQLVIHDASSGAEPAVGAAVCAGAERLVLTHFGPDDDDDVIDAIAGRARRLLDENGARATEVIAASEGLSLLV